MMYILDTNVISEIRKDKVNKADPAVISWNRTVNLNSCYLSVITIMELEMGVLSVARKDTRQGLVLGKWLEYLITISFRSRILDVDTAVARLCAASHVPDPQPDRDSLIAATAKLYGMSVVTRNTKDFSNMGVTLVNPWEFKA